MTQKEKAKAYDEALERAKSFQQKFGGDYAGYIFPELAESEDERIRKWILLKVREYVSKAPVCSDEIKMGDKAIDWLEKQKESLHISESCKENADSFTDSVIEVRSFQRELEEGRRQEQEKQKEQKPIKCIDFDNEFENQVSHLLSSVLNGEHKYSEGFVKYVAQSLLGYAKKELTPFNVCEICPYYKDCPDYQIIKSRMAAEWSEEDEEMISNVISSLRGYMCLASKSPYYTNHEAHIQKEIEFLNTLPERLSLQPKQEWSEEDEERLSNVIEIVECWRNSMTNVSFQGGTIDADLDWLKSLRPSWKPSEDEDSKNSK